MRTNSTKYIDQIIKVTAHAKNEIKELHKKLKDNQNKVQFKQPITVKKEEENVDVYSITYDEHQQLILESKCCNVPLSLCRIEDVIYILLELENMNNK